MFLRIIKIAEMLFALPLFTGSTILATRLLFGGGGRIGGDTIFLGYILVCINVFTFTLILFLEGLRKQSLFAVIVHCTSMFSVFLWLGLHLGGLIYSHESLFLDRQLEMEEMVRRLRESDSSKNK